MTEVALSAGWWGGGDTYRGTFPVLMNQEIESSGGTEEDMTPRKLDLRFRS